MSLTPVFDATLKDHDHDIWTAAPSVFPWPGTIEFDTEELYVFDQEKPVVMAVGRTTLPAELSCATIKGYSIGGTTVPKYIPGKAEW